MNFQHIVLYFWKKILSVFDNFGKFSVKICSNFILLFIRYMHMKCRESPFKLVFQTESSNAIKSGKWISWSKPGYCGILNMYNAYRYCSASIYWSESFNRKEIPVSRGRFYTLGTVKWNIRAKFDRKFVTGLRYTKHFLFNIWN